MFDAEEESDEQWKAFHSSSRYFHRVINKSGKNALAASVGPNDRWTLEERKVMEETVNSYCLEETHVESERRIFRHQNKAPSFLPRCQHSSKTDVVFRQLKRLLFTTRKPVIKLAVVPVSANPSSAVVTIKELDVISLTFEGTTDDVSCRRSFKARPTCADSSPTGLQVLVIPSQQ